MPTDYSLLLLLPVAIISRLQPIDQLLHGVKLLLTCCTFCCLHRPCTCSGPAHLHPPMLPSLSPSQTPAIDPLSQTDKCDTNQIGRTLLTRE